MNWISENKFLAGFIGFIVVGIGVLGFLLFQAMGDYGQVHQDYLAKVQDLNRLQNLTPYPNQENLAKYKEQKTQLAGIIGGLEQNLSAIQFPSDSTITPADFQDKLRVSVNAAVEKAKNNKVKLPEKFAFGFDQYLTAPPMKEAAPPLARELNAIEFVVNELLDSGVDSIATTPGISRGPLPEETRAKPATGLVVKSAVEISFVADQGKVRKVLNDLIETKKQFYIIRLIDIQNLTQKGVSKADALKNRTGLGGRQNLVAGNEKLQVSLKLEIVNFNPPSQK